MSANKPMTLKEKLAAARAGGAAKPAGEAGEPAEAVEAEEAPAAAPPPKPKAAAAPAASAGRPLSLKEKLAAARGGGAVQPAAEAAASAEDAEPAEAEAKPRAVPPAPPVPTGRPLTLAEKLAAARGQAVGAAPAAKPASAKPAAAKAAAAPAAKAARSVPPLAETSDPKDLAEHLRRAGSEQEKAIKEAQAKAAPPAKAAPKKLESKAIPPKPGREASTAAAAAAAPEAAPAARPSRRRFFSAASAATWVVVGWTSFVAGMSALTLACVRFMFPNVLAEPPSTIKVGLPGNFDKDSVDETWKAEWGFWIVRSSAYDGNDKIYALSSTCTHLGCPPNWLAGEQKFKCPCHGSGFYISGVNFEGPAPRPLERFKVMLNDAGEIIVDKSQKYQEELKQWVDPDSFVVA